jgi:lysozyme family protein
MADADLPTCMAFIFAAEGGYVDNPLDPGGATNMGITLDVLTAWRHSAVSKADVQALTKDEATAIYHANYWNVLRCSGLPGGIDLMAFDAGVNMGNGRSAKFVQTAVGAAVDGAIGPNTLAAVSAAVAAKGAAAIINALADARNAYYHTLATFDIFGAGWLARVSKAQALALQLAAPPAAGS